MPLTTYREVGLYPWLVRPLIPLFGVHSLMAVSLSFTVLCGWLFYFLLRRFYLGAWAAFAAAMVLAVVRHPLFFMGFVKWGVPSMTICTALDGSEPVYLAFFLCAFYAFKSDRVGLAFLLMGFATISRVLGAIVTAGFFVECLLQRKFRRSLWAAVPALFLFAHFLWFWHTSGNFFALFEGHHQFNHTVGSSFTWPGHDLVLAIRGQYRDTWETPWGWAFLYVYYLVGLVILAKKDRALFMVSAPLFLFFLCVNDWSLHGRYYDVLVGAPIAYFLLLPSPRGRAESPAPPASIL